MQMAILQLNLIYNLCLCRLFLFHFFVTMTSEHRLSNCCKVLFYLWPWHPKLFCLIHVDNSLLPFDMQFAFFFFLTFSYPDLRNNESQFYSQEQVKSLVSYAADRGIRVIPEVESA